MHWQATKSFPALVWLMVTGVFFSRGTFYMVWPFMAIFLYQKFQLNEWQVGLVLTSAALVAVGVGFYAGALTDKLGRKLMLLAAGSLSVLSFSLLAIAESLPLFIASLILAAISKDMWEPPAKAIISDLLPNVEQREAAFQIRYFAINVGAAVFPLAGVWLGATAHQSTFFATAAVYILLILCVLWGFKHNQSASSQIQTDDTSFSTIIKVLLQDHLFLLLVIANTLVAFIFAQMDTSLVQYLTRAGLPDVVKLISTLIFINAMTIVCLQFVLVRLLINFNLNQRVYVGTVLLTLGQLVFAFNPIDSYYGWYLGVFIISLGEAILFPTMSIQVDHIAPEHMRGAYYGASALYSLGYALAPYIGGLILQQWGGHNLFLSTAALGLLVFVLYYMTQYAKRPVFSSATSEE